MTKWLRSQRDFRLKSRQIPLWDVVPNATEREIISERDSAARKINFYRNSLGLSLCDEKSQLNANLTSYTSFPKRPRFQLPKVSGFQRAESQLKSWFYPGTEVKGIACSRKILFFDVWIVIAPRLKSSPKFLWPQSATGADKLTTALHLVHSIETHMSKQTITHDFQTSISAAEHKSIRRDWEMIRSRQFVTLLNYYDGGIRQLSQQHFREVSSLTGQPWPTPHVLQDEIFFRRARKSSGIPRQLLMRWQMIVRQIQDWCRYCWKTLLVNKLSAPRIWFTHDGRSPSRRNLMNKKSVKKVIKFVIFSFSSRWEAIKRTLSTDFRVSSSLWVNGSENFFFFSCGWWFTVIHWAYATYSERNSWK